ncbi:MAG: hypothetical protein JWN86_3935 [Planctomycetota bacterium]|nr:hypothetical protein [Planctomycetota bacterium]
MPETYACVPVNFDPATHLDPHLIDYADCARILLDTVFRKWTTHHARPTDPVPLKADRLRAYSNPDYRMFPLVRDSLVERGVLECDYRHEVGGKCYGYRLAEPFRTRHVRVKLTRKPLVRKIARDRRVAWEGSATPSTCTCATTSPAWRSARRRTTSPATWIMPGSGTLAITGSRRPGSPTETSTSRSATTGGSTPTPRTSPPVCAPISAIEASPWSNSTSATRNR